MIYEGQYPILEFDTNPEAKLMPGIYLKKTLPELCVITFFREALQRKVEKEQLKIIGYLYSEVVNIPIYEFEENGVKMCITMSLIGSAGAAGTIEELHAMGCEKFIICGGAGVLRKDLAVGHLMIPYSAVRDEGASYHYIAPSKEVECNPQVIECICKNLEKQNLPYIKGKTWTTDAIYRETKDKIEKRVSEGCISVEMEAAAFFAVAKFLNVKLGQILYAGDDLSGEEWDKRGWNKRDTIRENLISLAIEICQEL